MAISHQYLHHKPLRIAETWRWGTGLYCSIPYLMIMWFSKLDASHRKPPSSSWVLPHEVRWNKMLSMTAVILSLMTNLHDIYSKTISIIIILPFQQKNNILLPLSNTQQVLSPLDGSSQVHQTLHQCRGRQSCISAHAPCGKLMEWPALLGQINENCGKTAVFLINI